MRILICDDEPAMVKQISEIIADAYPDIELVGVHSSAELSEKLAPEDANRKFDLAFLDIAVSDESGVDIAEFVGALCPGVKIVFVSGNQDLVSKAFVTVDDCGYIYKPSIPNCFSAISSANAPGCIKDRAANILNTPAAAASTG